MGSGISTVCGSKRSVLIANSVRKLPPIPENDTHSDFETEDIDIRPSVGKLHPADSRDSGIGENEIPNLLFHRENASRFSKNNSSSDSSPEKVRGTTTEPANRPSRPHSCRLGHRGSSQDVTKKSKRNGISDSQIKRLVQSAKGQPGVPSLDLGSNENGFESSDNDTLSNNSFSSPDRDTRPRSARRKFVRKSQKARSDGRNSARTISDLDTSTDTENSDMDMLSIPDETGIFRGTPRRRGWVKNEEDFTDVTLSPSFTPRAGSFNDSYRIVSGTYSDADVNLAKKASERSISSIILTPFESGSCTPTSTNSEYLDASNESRLPTEGSLEDLVTALVRALEKQKSKGPCTSEDYENVMKSLRYQLVAMAMNSASVRSSTPRLEVQGEQCTLFSNDSWKVQIRLRVEDEELLETSEKTLAQRLSQKGERVTRGDISIILSEHLRTIERLQEVERTGKIPGLRIKSHPPRLSETIPQKSQPKATSSESDIHKTIAGGKQKKNIHVLSREPLSDLENNAPKVTSRLPPIGNTRASQINVKSKTTTEAGHSSGEGRLASDLQYDVDSLQSSPESKPRNRKHFNESGIDSECEDTETSGFEDEEAFMNAELVEAFQLLWDTLADTDVRDLLTEYRKRQTDCLSAFGCLRTSSGPSTPEKTGTSEAARPLVRGANPGPVRQSHGMEARQRQSEKDIQQADKAFVCLYRDKRQGTNLTFEAFCDVLSEHMKKTKLIRVQSFREDGSDHHATRSNSFSGFGPPRQNSFTGLPLARQHSFSGSVVRQNSYGGGATRQNSFIRALPASRQSSFCRTRSRGSTGSSYTFSTTSSGIVSDADERSASVSTKSGVSREISFGMLNEFEDIEETEESRLPSHESKTLKDNQKPPAGPMQTGLRVATNPPRDRDTRRRAGQTQVHGLGAKHTEPLRKIEEDSMPKVEEVRPVEESKLNMRSRPDSGIAVSTSSASYSSETLKEADDIDECAHVTSSQEMLDMVSKVQADVHNDMKSLVAAITKGLNTEHAKAHALYCWLASQDVKQFSRVHKKNNSPPGKLRQLLEKKTSYSIVYIDMLKVAGLKAEKVEGYLKTKDYLPGNTVRSQKFHHSWAAVSVDGQYRLVDPQSGSTGEKFVMDHYFATSPDEFLMSHFPKDSKWLLMNQIAAVDAFEGILKTWPAMFHFHIRPLNMKSVVRTYDGRLSITVLLRDVAVNPQLEYAGPGPELDSFTLEEKIDHEIRDVDNAETYHVNLPQEGTYYFTVFAHVLEDGIDVPVFQYRIEYTDELL